MNQPPSREKILGLAPLLTRVKSARRRGESIVFTNGCFDLVHRGHVRSLEEASGLGDRLIVAINSDASVGRLKGATRPVTSARSRMEVVAALGCVDWVVGFGADTPIRPILAIRPDVLAKGGDWAADEIVGAEQVEAWGGRVARLGLVAGESTTETVARIRHRTPRRKR